MTLANLASEMGAKNAVFPPDDVLKSFFGPAEINAIWADPDARYVEEMDIDLSEVVPLVAAPHHVDHVKTVAEVAGTRVQQGLIGTCTNGRIEDMREAAAILRDRQVAEGFQLLVVPASRDIYLQAIEEGLISIFLKAGANVLSASCGPCLGTGQGIPADGFRVISTANRNFRGRMGNKEAEIYLASPATVASSAITGEITSCVVYDRRSVEFRPDQKPGLPGIAASDDRRINGVWNYADVDNLNTDQMFAGNLTYTVSSADPGSILPHLFAGFDPSFSAKVRKGDIILAGENFGCGSSREHPAVGLAYAGVKAVIVKSVNRIFFRSSVNQGLILIVQPEVVKLYRHGDKVTISLDTGTIELNDRIFHYPPLPLKLQDIITKHGLVNWIKES
jgi:3-isopropylmalate dehydratase small subunit